MLLVPVLLVGCGGGTGPQPIPAATTGPTATASPVAIATPEKTTPGRANFNLTVGSSEVVRGQGTAQIGQNLYSLSVYRPIAVDVRTSITLNVASSHALVRGDVIAIGSGASGSATRFGRGITTGDFPFGRWVATGGQIRVQSVSGRAVILQEQDVVFSASNQYASGTFICNGTIQVVR